MSKHRDDITTIEISKENQMILKTIGNMGDSYNDVIDMILINGGYKIKGYKM